MRDLGEIRKDIDAIDQQITALFEQRMNLTRQVAEYKLARCIDAVCFSKWHIIGVSGRDYFHPDIVENGNIIIHIKFPKTL